MIRRLLLALSLALMLTDSAQAQKLDALAAKQQAKLEGALQRLNTQREQIQQSQVPLAQKLNALEDEARTLRSELILSQRTQDSRSLDLETLRAQGEAQEKELSYASRTLLPEFFANLNAVLSTGEDLHREHLRELMLLMDDPHAPKEEQLGRSHGQVMDAIHRLQTLMGGARYGGQALGDTDELLDGTFIQIGPLLYFHPDAKQARGTNKANSYSDQAGVVVATKSRYGRIHPLPSKQVQAIAQVAESGTGILPVDPSMGDALAIAETRDSLGQHLKKGGIWVYPIISLALIATLAAVLKFVQIFTIRFPQPMVIHDIVKHLRDGEKDAARTLAQRQPRILRTMLVSAVDHSDESIDLVEEVMYESMLTTQPKLEHYLNIIAVTAATAPLLGLLGTVTGIIKTFDLMAVFGAGDPKPLISGISEALITTELGLVLAIPALIIHALLSRRVAGILARMEKSAIAFVNGLSRKTRGTA